jgi:hypothetical protein
MREGDKLTCRMILHTDIDNGNGNGNTMRRGVI